MRARRTFGRIGLLAFILPTPVLAQEARFLRDDYASSAGARAVAIADFNRDGWADVAHANLDTAGVSILLSDRGQRMTLATSVQVGAGPFDLAQGDFNRDGIPDLAVATADADAISILLGRGDGRFTRSNVPTSPYRSPRGIAAADVNGDGVLDLVHTAYTSNLVRVLLGTGTGTFTPGWTFVGYAAQPQGVAAADFNRDGHADIAVGYNSAGGLAVHYGKGGGAFTLAAIGGQADVNVLAVADLDGNGWPDVAAASTNRSRLAVYLGSRSGLAYARSYWVDSDPRGVAIGDVDGDGVADVITASRTTSTVSVLLGDPSNRGSFRPKLSIPSGAGSRAVAAVDLNGDGRIDLVTGNQFAAAVSILTNVTPALTAAYSFGRTAVETDVELVSRPWLLQEADGFASADFNGDGRLDFVQRVAAQDAVAVMVTGAGTIVLPVPGTDVPRGHLVADVNGDGWPDVVTTGGDQVISYLNDRTGRFGGPIPSAHGVYGCVPADMNRDARMDLVCAGRVLTGEGNGRFVRGAAFMPQAEGAEAGLVQVADMNRDGALDVVAESGDVWFGDGRGGLFHAGGLPDYGGDQIVLADLNHDGRPDAVFSDGGTSLSVRLGGTTGLLGDRVWEFAEGLEAATDYAVADVNVDGHPDIVLNFLVYDADTAGVMKVIPGRGDGTFAPAQALGIGAGEVLAADVNRDGLPDIVSAGPDALDVLVNRRSETNRPPVVAAGDVTVDYQPCITLPVTASDPDQHALWVEWNAGVDVFPIGRMDALRSATACIEAPGTFRFGLTVDDGRGAVVTREFTVTVGGAKEIVLDMRNATALGTGAWSLVTDSTAAFGMKAYNENLGAPKVNVPAAAPAAYVELSFLADSTRTYKLWLRLKADADYWANDSVWVQFSGSADSAGMPAYRIGTRSGLAVNLESCLNCGSSGWGWEDDGWGAPGLNGVTLRFPDGGAQTLRIQTREDGVSVDQVVLSAERYVTTAPGAAKDDTTILTAP